jgi:hypothetical protein
VLAAKGVLLPSFAKTSLPNVSLILPSLVLSSRMMYLYSTHVLIVSMRSAVCAMKVGRTWPSRMYLFFTRTMVLEESCKMDVSLNA